jgi:hypothetical protein
MGGGTAKGQSRYADHIPVTVSRWLAAGLLVWGLFTGITYALTPLLTDGWGNGLSTASGVVLIVVCGALLVRLDPRQR